MTQYRMSGSKIPNSMIESDLVKKGNWPNKMHLRRTKPARELRQALQGNKMLPREPVSSQENWTKHSIEDKMHSKISDSDIT